MALTPTEEAQTRTLLAQQSQILSLASEEPAILSSLGATDVNLSQLPAAGSVADADILLLRQGSTDKSVTGSALKSYAQPAAASETINGIIELATNAEVQAGTDAARAVTPAGRRADTATIASDPTYADNSTKSASTQWVRNAMLAIATAAGFMYGGDALSGGVKLPSWLGGFIFQWGGTSAVASQSFGTTTLYYTFPNAIYCGTITLAINTGLSFSASAGIEYVGTSQIRIYPFASNGSSTSYKYYVIGR